MKTISDTSENLVFNQEIIIYFSRNKVKYGALVNRPIVTHSFVLIYLVTLDHYILLDIIVVI